MAAIRSSGIAEMRHGKTSIEFTGTKLEAVPASSDSAAGARGRELDSLAQQLATASTREEDERIRGRMIALQEELDWDVYHRYGLLTDEQAADLIAAPASVPNLHARPAGVRDRPGAADGDAANSRPSGSRGTVRPRSPRSRRSWPEEYRRVVERRIEVIESNRNIGLIERPECKRRWQSEPWEVREARRLTTWLLDKCEDRSLWYDGDEPRPMTVNRLADRLRTDAEVIATARQLKGP